MTRLYSALLGASALAMVSGTALAAPLSNGDFSTGSGFLNLNHLTSWTKTGGTVSTLLGGNWFASFVGNGVSTLSQTFDGLTAEASYILSFDLAGVSVGGGGVDDKFSVSINGSTPVSYGIGSLTTLTVNFIAGATNVLNFSALTTLTNTGTFFHPIIHSSAFALDNVSVIPAPLQSVPGPIAGAGLPFLVVGGALLMRRRNSRA